ncbi:MAG TPA: alpha/beta hydrolase [Halanaerobiales bacterium]|nr:alpha/beta hydrolase [Halanaerobiales bacterium]
MFSYHKVTLVLFLILFVVFLTHNNLFANDDDNHLILKNKVFDLKYSNMVNLEFIEFNDYDDLIKKDITYKKINDEELQLDILYPEVKLTKSYPVVVYIHGGGFIRGDKDEIYDLKPLVDEWHKNGWIVVSINYRLLYGDKIFPDNYRDVKDAIYWIINNKSKYNFDIDQICAVGHSAGGTLALLTGLNNNKVNCIVSMSGPTKLYGKETFEFRKKIMSAINTNKFDEDIMKKASPINYINENSPPIMLLHGTKDNFVPFNQSQLFYEKAQKLGADCKFISIEGSGHVLEFSYLPRMPYLKNEIVKFMEDNIKAK